MSVRVATLDEVLRYGSRGGHKALRARGLLPPISGAAPPALVQATGNATATATYGSNVTAGNTLLVAVSKTSTAQTFTVSDATNGAWTAIAGTKYNTTFASVQWFFFNSTAGGVKPVVTAAGGGTANSIIIHEVSGLAALTTGDGSNATEGTSAAPATSVTVGTAGDFVIGYAIVANTASVGAGFSAGGSDGNGSQTEYVVAGSSGALSVAFTQTSGLFAVSAFAALPAAGVAAVSSFKPRRMPLGV